MKPNLLASFLSVAVLTLSMNAAEAGGNDREPKDNRGQPGQNDVHDCRDNACRGGQAQTGGPVNNGGNATGTGIGVGIGHGVGHGGHGGQGGGAEVDNSFDGSVNGEFNNDVNNEFNGSVEGTVNGNVEGTVNGSVTGENNNHNNNQSGAEATGGNVGDVNVNNVSTYKAAKQVGIAPNVYLNPAGECGEGWSLSVGFVGGSVGGGMTDQSRTCLSQNAAQAIINAGLVRGDDGMIAGGLRGLANLHTEIDGAISTVANNIQECEGQKPAASPILLAQKDPYCNKP
jgi:hypothetical protein